MGQIVFLKARDRCFIANCHAKKTSSLCSKEARKQPARNSPTRHGAECVLSELNEHMLSVASVPTPESFRTFLLLCFPPKKLARCPLEDESVELGDCVCRLLFFTRDHIIVLKQGRTDDCLLECSWQVISWRQVCPDSDRIELLAAAWEYETITAHQTLVHRMVHIFVVGCQNSLSYLAFYTSELCLKFIFC